LDQIRVCEKYFTTYQRFVADQSAISPFLGGKKERKTNAVAILAFSRLLRGVFTKPKTTAKERKKRQKNRKKRPAVMTNFFHTLMGVLIKTKNQKQTRCLPSAQGRS